LLSELSMGEPAKPLVWHPAARAALMDVNFPTVLAGCD
jgi:hypothetical protein